MTYSAAIRDTDNERNPVADMGRRSRGILLGAKEACSRQPGSHTPTAGSDRVPDAAMADRQAKAAPARIQTKTGDERDAAVGRRVTRRALVPTRAQETLRSDMSAALSRPSPRHLAGNRSSCRIALQPFPQQPQRDQPAPPSSSQSSFVGGGSQVARITRSAFFSFTPGSSPFVNSTPAASGAATCCHLYAWLGFACSRRRPN
jgi:hypothetical protein